MLCLKYPEPEEVSQGHPAGSVFVLPPQGQPGASSATGIILSVCAGICRSNWGR